MLDIWYPKIYIGNAVNYESLSYFGPKMEKVDSLWFFKTEHGLYYSQILTTTVSCSLNFQPFPFDFHECILEFKSWMLAEYRMVLESPKIYKDDINYEEIVQTSCGKLDYDFNFKPMNSSSFLGKTFFIQISNEIIFLEEFGID